MDNKTTTGSTAVFFLVLGSIIFAAGLVFWLLWMSSTCSILFMFIDDGISKDTVSLCEALLSYSLIVLGIFLMLLGYMGQQPPKEVT
jgi:hypothetical protein